MPDKNNDTLEALLLRRASSIGSPYANLPEVQQDILPMPMSGLTGGAKKFTEIGKPFPTEPTPKDLHNQLKDLALVKITREGLLSGKNLLEQFSGIHLPDSWGEWGDWIKEDLGLTTEDLGEATEWKKGK